MMSGYKRLALLLILTDRTDLRINDTKRKKLKFGRTK